MSRSFALLLFAVGGLAGCRAASRPAPSADCSNPYGFAADLSRPRIPVASPPAAGMAIVIGTMTDSTSGRGVESSVVNLFGIGASAKDTVSGRPDSTGAFMILVRPGRYKLQAGRPNYHLIRDTVVVRPGIDTLLLSPQRGAPLCHVSYLPCAVVRNGNGECST